MLLLARHRLVDLILFVKKSQKLLHVPVCRTSLVRHHIVDLNVQVIVNVLLIKPVSTKNAKIPASTHVVLMLSVEQLVTLQRVSVIMALLEIHSLIVINNMTFILRSLHHVIHRLVGRTPNAESITQLVLVLVYLITLVTPTKDAGQNAL